VIGPNVRRLITLRAAKITIARATAHGGDPFCAVLAEIGKPGVMVRDHQEAVAWVRTALAAASLAPGNAEWPTDEAMAGEILRRLKEQAA